MIKLLITDLDGCLSLPFEQPDWDALLQIRDLNQKSKYVANIPPLTICTGRPLPYVEAFAQWLGIYVSVIFDWSFRNQPTRQANSQTYRAISH